jgi:hypothetical protein
MIRIIAGSNLLNLADELRELLLVVWRPSQDAIENFLYLVPGHDTSEPRCSFLTCSEFRRRLVERFSKFELYARHSGARVLAREPGIHNHRPGAMDSGLATFGGAPE